MIKGLVPYRKREWAWCRHEHSEGDLRFLASVICSGLYLAAGMPSSFAE